MKYLSGSGHRESYTLVARKRYMKKVLYVQKTHITNSHSSIVLHSFNLVVVVVWSFTLAIGFGFRETNIAVCVFASHVCLACGVADRRAMRTYHYRRSIHLDTYIHLILPLLVVVVVVAGLLLLLLLFIFIFIYKIALNCVCVKPIACIFLLGHFLLSRIVDAFH